MKGKETRVGTRKNNQINVCRNMEPKEKPFSRRTLALLAGDRPIVELGNLDVCDRTLLVSGR